MSLNKVICSGRFGQDPELRYTPSGKAVCNFQIAIDMGKDENSIWPNFVAWNATAELIEKHFKKGDGIEIDGMLTMESWEDRETGKLRYKTVILVNRIGFPPSSRSGGNGGGGAQQRSSSSRPGAGSRAGGRPGGGAPASRPGQKPEAQRERDLGIDDIPF